MFRNPRENATVQQAAVVLPSTGRPPTPPSSGAKQSPYFTPASSLMNKQSPTSTPQVPIIGRQSSIKLNSGKKNGLRSNQSILSFFGKAERVENATSIAEEAGLFFEESSPAKPLATNQSPISLRDDEGLRYNEQVTPIKRRKIDTSKDDVSLRTPSPERGMAAMAARLDKDESEMMVSGKTSQKRRGGFVDDSSDDEDEASGVVNPRAQTNNLIRPEDDIGDPNDDGRHGEDIESVPTERKLVEVVETTKIPLKPPGDEQSDFGARRNHQVSEDMLPSLSREATSVVAPGEFGDDEEFENEEFFEEGEEFLERRWMEEQQAMEATFDEDSKSESGTDGPRTPSSNVFDEGHDEVVSTESIALCPICNGSMRGLSETAASTHVNACLDGTAPPLKSEALETAPAVLKPIKSSTPQLSGSAKRYQRSGVPRPAQANPFATMSDSKAKGSAFNRLMTGHAEDAAWAEAAANEQQSRGKPAYQRTCPFYKIMPGLYTCVDAFRYGKVEGQNAYFLSHFHSDHYIGLTSTWSHGPIYASKVSCNLMRQQLRVDPKWLRPLEFEKKTEIPDTQGVFVTMIPANHCPGSSLYLFEKVVGKNKDGTAKLNRILHCGDFRACPAHINHPLLRPDVLDAISGQTKQQVIDTCYLDTTYLTPKFSFPSQSDVIDACAQMCVSLAKEIPDDNDSWEKVKMAKAGSVMTKFLDEGKNELIKSEEEVEDKKPRVRGRLLVVIGTYSIGKERICMGIAKALKSKIFAPPAKMRICKALEDAELNALLTSNPLEAQVHMQTLMEIRAETLHDYLITFKGHFHRVVGFRPTGWTYRPPTSRFTDNPAVNTVLYSEGWKSRFSMKDLAPQRGSTKESNCFGVPYSEHSSFRELTMFCCALRINRVIPTVNVGSAKSRERMKGWIEKWDLEKKKTGLFKVEVGNEGWGSGDGKLRYGV